MKPLAGWAYIKKLKRPDSLMKTAYIIAALLAAGFLAGYVTAVFWAPTFFPNIFKAVA